MKSKLVLAKFRQEKHYVLRGDPVSTADPRYRIYESRPKMFNRL